MSQLPAPLPADAPPQGMIAGIVRVFLEGQLAIILVIAALALGIASMAITAREEEPQIVVPMADILVDYPGASAFEVEQLVATPLERLLWQVDGVEHVYSVSHPDRAVVTARFFVGEDREASLSKLHRQVAAHMDLAPAGVQGWLIKPVEIDDVPILTIALHDDGQEQTPSFLDEDAFALRRIGEEVLARLDRLPDISRTRLVGGSPRVIEVLLQPERLRAHGLCALSVQEVLVAADASLAAAAFDRDDTRIPLRSGPFLRSVDDLANLVIGAHEGRPVYLRDLAEIRDGPDEARSYTRIGLRGGQHSISAVSLELAKKPGTNAVAVAQRVLDEMQNISEQVLPQGVTYTATRNYGATADAKVNELFSSLAFAMITVVGILIFTLGWREGLIVALAVPVSFSLALFVNYISGYTINRVTLFALILTLGLVVDDPITNVDNIQRHILMRKRSAYNATLYAVREVLPPVIMSTIAIILSFVPLFFITGMMGPYMQPMAVNVPLTVVFSTLAALTVVPWAAFHLLKGRAQQSALPSAEAAQTASPTRLARIYAAVVRPLLQRRLARWAMLGGVVLLMLGAGVLVLLRQVPMKMLPFDNKNELQLVIDMPDDSTLERSDAVVRDFERYLFRVPEITDFQSFVGTHSPIDFNALVRRYYFREQPHQADIRINLLPKERRQQQSHAIALRMRRDLEALAQRHDARLAIVESPPGPPVLATVVAEVRGSMEHSHQDLLDAAELVAERMRQEPGLRDVAVMRESPRTRYNFSFDSQKAALHGIRSDRVVQSQALALVGSQPASVHVPGERQPLMVALRYPRSLRSGSDALERIHLSSDQGSLVELAELGSLVQEADEPAIYHKDLERVVFVTGEMVGRAPPEAILDLMAHFRQQPLPQGIRLSWAGEGEWEITLRVFRDLGLAFAAAMLGIYILLIIQTKSFLMPMVIMTSIPLTAIGIMPGFWLLNLLVNRPIDGFATPVFFTATAMIGMIALGGIVVRNAIVLIEFIEERRRQGEELQTAVLSAGAVRMRPILLTAVTTAFGAWPITLDPIFSGLAWSLIFGLIASTAFTLIVVPVLYFMIYHKAAPA